MGAEMGLPSTAKPQPLLPHPPPSSYPLCCLLLRVLELLSRRPENVSIRLGQQHIRSANNRATNRHKALPLCITNTGCVCGLCALVRGLDEINQTKMMMIVASANGGGLK